MSDEHHDESSWHIFQKEEEAKLHAEAEAQAQEPTPKELVKYTAEFAEFVRAEEAKQAEDGEKQRDDSAADTAELDKFAGDERAKQQEWE